MKARIVLSGVLLSAAALAANARMASAECNCVSVAAEVAASIQADVAKADGLYARGDFAAAAAAYAKAHAKAPDPELQFAQGMALWMSGNLDDAKVQLAAYVGASGSLAFKAKAEAAIDQIEAGVVGGVVAGAGAAGGAAAGALGGAMGNPAGEVDGAVGAVGGVGGAALGATGMVDRPKPPKVAKGAAIVLGIVAVGAIGAVGIHGIGSLKDDVEFDTKFGLGLGLSGVVVGGTAIYLWGLTAAAGATASAPCLTYKGTTITPTVSGEGGGIAAFGRF